MLKPMDPNVPYIHNEVTKAQRHEQAAAVIRELQEVLQRHNCTLHYSPQTRGMMLGKHLDAAGHFVLALAHIVEINKQFPVWEGFDPKEKTQYRGVLIGG